MTGVDIKSPEEIQIMAEGGGRLAKIRQILVRAVKPGITGLELDRLAEELIRKAGGQASFGMVPGYSHSTCINVNETVVHGIPNKERLKAGDVVGIDVGLYYKGFHTDTSTTVVVEGSKVNIFLETGKSALKKAINEARAGKRVMDISRAMEETVEGAGYNVVRALTGHGVGRQLHEEPAVPCFTLGSYQHSPALVVGMVLAIEAMYNEGGSDVAYKNADGWTIVTRDGKISALFEETVAITKSGPVILTQTAKR